jgi:hypothetical protein
MENFVNACESAIEVDDRAGGKVRPEKVHRTLRKRKGMKLRISVHQLCLSGRNKLAAFGKSTC